MLNITSIWGKNWNAQWNICRCRLPSFFLYLWSLLTVKSQIFPFTILFTFWKHNNYDWLIHKHCFKRKNDHHVPQGLISGKPISKQASNSVKCMFSPLHSNISKEQHEKNLFSYYWKGGKFTCEMYALYLNMSSYNISISAMPNSLHKHFQFSHAEAIACLPQIEKIGAQRRTKVAP